MIAEILNIAGAGTGALPWPDREPGAAEVPDVVPEITMDGDEDEDEFFDDDDYEDDDFDDEDESLEDDEDLEEDEDQMDDEEEDEDEEF